MKRIKTVISDLVEKFEQKLSKLDAKEIEIAIETKNKEMTAQTQRLDDIEKTEIDLKLAKCEAAFGISDARQDKFEKLFQSQLDCLLRNAVDCTQLIYVGLGKSLDNSKSSQKMKEETLRFHDYLINKQKPSSINSTYWPEKATA